MNEAAATPEPRITLHKLAPEAMTSTSMAAPSGVWFGLTVPGGRTPGGQRSRKTASVHEKRAQICAFGRSSELAGESASDAALKAKLSAS